MHKVASLLALAKSICYTNTLPGSLVVSTSPTLKPNASAFRANFLHTGATCWQAGHQGAKLLKDKYKMLLLQ